LLAFGIHHHFSDGYGFFTLIDRFSKWIRLKDETKIKTFIYDRTLLKPATDIRYEHIEYTTKAPQFSFSEMPVMDVIVKKYTKQELFDKLKITSKTVSFNDVLVAWLTQTISKIREVPSDEIINVGMASDGRNELGIGSDYFGNCNFFICFQFKMIDLMNKSVTELAEEINMKKKRINDKRSYDISTCLGEKSADNCSSWFSSIFRQRFSFYKLDSFSGI
jgi:hypothetical protein